MSAGRAYEEHRQRSVFADPTPLIVRYGTKILGRDRSGSGLSLLPFAIGKQKHPRVPLLDFGFRQRNSRQDIVEIPLLRVLACLFEQFHDSKQFVVDHRSKAAGEVINRLGKDFI